MDLSYAIIVIPHVYVTDLFYSRSDQSLNAIFVALSNLIGHLLGSNIIIFEWASLQARCDTLMQQSLPVSLLFQPLDCREQGVFCSCVFRFRSASFNH